MSSVVIASKSDSVHFAECQVLAEYLARNCPGFAYDTMLKHKDEWKSF